MSYYWQKNALHYNTNKYASMFLRRYVLTCLIFTYRCRGVVSDVLISNYNAVWKIKSPLTVSWSSWPCRCRVCSIKAGHKIFGYAALRFLVHRSTKALHVGKINTLKGGEAFLAKISPFSDTVSQSSDTVPNPIFYFSGGSHVATKD